LLPYEAEPQQVRDQYEATWIGTEGTLTPVAPPGLHIIYELSLLEHSMDFFLWNEKSKNCLNLERGVVEPVVRQDVIAGFGDAS
jgi:hypothetical protein